MTSFWVANTINWTAFALWLVLGVAFWRKKLARRYPATGKYLMLRIVASPVLALFSQILSSAHGESAATLTTCRTVFYWTAYLAGAVLLFYICIEIFRAALSSYPGLMKFGVVIVRWVAVVSVVVSLTPLLFAHHDLAAFTSLATLTEVATEFLRAVSVVEISLLAFLCIGMNALGLSYREFSFGLAAGFGVLSISDLVKAAYIESANYIASPAQIVRGALIILALTIWLTYCALPARERKPEQTASAATVARWNEIADALGHNGARVNVQPRHADGFFLTDVECVVDKVLNRNLKSGESQS